MRRVGPDRINPSYGLSNGSELAENGCDLGSQWIQSDALGLGGGPVLMQEWEVLDGWLAADGLWIQGEELHHVRRHVTADGEPESQGAA